MISPPGSPWQKSDRPCARDLASAGKARGGGDARASSTTSNAVRRRQTPGALWVAGRADRSALLRLLDGAWASPVSPRLASGPAAPATRPIRLLPRAAMGQSLTSQPLARRIRGATGTVRYNLASKSGIPGSAATCRGARRPEFPRLPVFPQWSSALCRCASRSDRCRESFRQTPG